MSIIRNVCRVGMVVLGEGRAFRAIDRREGGAGVTEFV
jgi:hypothetical protein